MAADLTQTSAAEWVSFPGGELEGERPKARCAACRAASSRSGQPSSTARTLCFQCYRAELDRQRTLAAAGTLNTGSIERFQYQLPFESVNIGRLELLKAARSDARGVLLPHAGRFEDRRRRAQIAARHALQATIARATTRGAKTSAPSRPSAEVLAALHAAELQLPESWWPFVMSR